MRKRIFDDEQCGLRDGGLRDPFLGGGAICVRWVEDGAQIQSEMWPQHFGTFVNFVPKARFGSVEGTSHVDVLRALAREQEGDARELSLRFAAEHALRIRLRQQSERLVAVTANQCAAMAEGTAADLQRVGRIGQVDGVRRGKMLLEPRGCLIEARRRARRQHEQLATAPRATRLDGGCLFEHHMGVRAADPEGTHAGAAWCSTGLPGLQSAH